MRRSSSGHPVRQRFGVRRLPAPARAVRRRPVGPDRGRRPGSDRVEGCPDRGGRPGWRPAASRIRRRPHPPGTGRSRAGPLRPLAGLRPRGDPAEDRRVRRRAPRGRVDPRRWLAPTRLPRRSPDRGRPRLGRSATARRCLVNADHHGAWANSRALELAGVSSSTPDPVDGRIERGPDGSPTGTSARGCDGSGRPAGPGDHPCRAGRRVDGGAGVSPLARRDGLAGRDPR